MTANTNHKNLTTTDNNPEKNDFIRAIIRNDLAQHKYPQIVTRFPPSQMAICI